MAGKFRVGLIGAGGIARGAHLPGWQALKDKGVEIAAAADPDRGAAEKTAAQFQIPRIYRDYREMLRREKLEAVSICSPAAFHAEQSVAALGRGLHVLCEKPLCVSTRECRRIAQAAKKSRRVFMTAQNHRFGGAARALKAYAADGLLGDIYYVHARALRRRLLPARPTFTSRRLSGGGTLLDIGVHILDLSWWMMGCPRPVTVSGVTSNRMIPKGGKLYNSWGDWDPKATDVEDFACGLIRFATGATLFLETSFILNMKENTIFQANFYGTEAGASWPDCEIFGERNKQVTDTRIVNVPKLDHYKEEVAAFHAAATGRGRSPVPLEQTYWIIAMLEGLYRSAAAGREVRLAGG